MYNNNMAIKVAGLLNRPVLEMVLFNALKLHILFRNVSFQTDRRNILWAYIKMTWSNIGKILLPYQ